MDRWQQCRRAGYPDGVVACAAGLHAKRIQPALVPMRVVIVVVIVDSGPWRVVVAVMVAVGRRTVLMFRMCVSLVRVYMLRRRGRQSGHRQRQHERQESVHEDESTTRARTSVKSKSPERDRLACSVRSAWLSAPSTRCGARCPSRAATRRADLRVVEGKEAQFVQAFENVKKVLTAAGATFDDVVEIVCRDQMHGIGASLSHAPPRSAPTSRWTTFSSPHAPRADRPLGEPNARPACHGWPSTRRACETATRGAVRSRASGRTSTDPSRD